MEPISNEQPLNNYPAAPVGHLGVSTSKPFITANTVESTLEEIKTRHVIPVFTRDNEPVISHSDFIECTLDIAAEVFAGETILRPAVRLSHEIKGRVPEARHKPAHELLDHERTLYYERYAFLIEVPSLCEQVAGNPLSLTVGGVKAYNQDNLGARKGSGEHFKIFIGFKNTVCCNLCVWSDGYVGDLKVKNLEQLRSAMRTLFSAYSATEQLQALRRLPGYGLSEQQFAQLLGRLRMYPYLPASEKKDIAPLPLGDSQLIQVVRDYYRDDSFCRGEDGGIDLWRLFNLFTAANKTSYIDSFADRSVGAYQFVDQLREALETSRTHWFLN